MACCLVVILIPSGKFIVDAKGNCSVLGKHRGLYRAESNKQTDVQSKTTIQVDTWIVQNLGNNAKICEGL